MKIITYNVDYIRSFSNKINKPLPHSVLKLINLQTKINAKMQTKDLKIFNRVLDNFTLLELQKKINSLLNKLSDNNFKNIYQKVNEILKNRKVLIEYTIQNLVNKAICQPMFIDIYALFYKELYNENTKNIFANTFQNLLNVLEQNEKDLIDVDKYDDFCKYILDKTKFSGLFLFLSSLYKNKIVNKNIINQNIKYLEKNIIKSNNDKYCEAYCKFLIKLNDINFIDLKILKKIKSKDISMKNKFQIMDIEDLFKKLNKK